MAVSLFRSSGYEVSPGKLEHQRKYTSLPTLSLTSLLA